MAKPHYPERLRGTPVPVEWTKNEGSTLRELEAGMQYRYSTSDDVYRVVSAGPMGACIVSAKMVKVTIPRQRHEGDEDAGVSFTAHNTRTVMIALMSGGYYRRGEHMARAAAKKRVATHPEYVGLAPKVAAHPEDYVPSKGVASLVPEAEEESSKQTKPQRRKKVEPVTPPHKHAAKAKEEVSVERQPKKRTASREQGAKRKGNGRGKKKAAPPKAQVRKVVKRKSAVHAASTRLMTASERKRLERLKALKSKPKSKPKKSAKRTLTKLTKPTKGRGRGKKKSKRSR